MDFISCYYIICWGWKCHSGQVPLCEAPFGPFRQWCPSPFSDRLLVQVSHILGSVGSISREKKVRLPGSVW